jgi:hypothetical protein
MSTKVIFMRPNYPQLTSIGFNMFMKFVRRKEARRTEAYWID